MCPKKQERPAVAAARRKRARMHAYRDPAVQVRCPHCGASPGELCITSPGRAGIVHRRRVDAWALAKKRTQRKRKATRTRNTRRATRARSAKSGRFATQARAQAAPTQHVIEQIELSESQGVLVPGEPVGEP